MNVESCFQKPTSGRSSSLLSTRHTDLRTSRRLEAGLIQYTELCRCLSEFVGLPIFTLSLSTASKFHHFSPPGSQEYSSRIVRGDNWVLPPITETGFDQFALNAKEGEITLDQVMEEDWICRLGRPLYVFRARGF
jgi:hypothetical protein